MKSSLLLGAALLSGVAFGQYCTVASNSTSCGGGDEFISNVTVSNLNNSSLVCVGPPMYEDYTGLTPVDLISGQSYAISVTISQSWATDRVYVILDSGLNGAFNAGELVGSMGPLTTTGGTQVLNGTINIPVVAGTNVLTRLRVRMVYGTAAAGNEACQVFGYGNCEDYTARLNPGNPAPPEYQVNQGNASMDIDGVAGNQNTPAQVTRCLNSLMNVNLGSPLAGNPFDVVLSTFPLVPRSSGLGFGTPVPQVCNIDLTQPFSFAYGGFGGSFVAGSIPVAFGFPIDLYTQMAVVDGSNPDGLTMSQPNGLHIVSGAGLAGYVPPTGDDNVNTLPAAACLSFYGQIRTNAWLTTNGRVGFGTAPSATFGPTTAQAMTGDASAGYWNDLNVVAGTSIVASNPAAGVTRFQWNNVPYFGSTIANNFGIQIDNNVNAVQIDGPVGGFAANTGTAFFGVSNGSGGSSDPGSINYGTAVFGSGTPAPNPGMIYNLGPRGMALGSYVGVVYIWNATSGNYDWTAF